MHGPMASIFLRTGAHPSTRKIGAFREPYETSMSSADVVLLNTDTADELSLLEILDHVLNSGIVIHGSLVISLAGVDLVYLGVNAVLTSVETALRHLQEPESKR